MMLIKYSINHSIEWIGLIEFSCLYIPICEWFIDFFVLWNMWKIDFRRYELGTFGRNGTAHNLFTHVNVCQLSSKCFFQRWIYVYLLKCIFSLHWKLSQMHRQKICMTNLFVVIDKCEVKQTKYFGWRCLIFLAARLYSLKYINGK